MIEVLVWFLLKFNLIKNYKNYTVLFIIITFWLTNNIFFESIATNFPDFFIYKLVFYLNNSKLNIILFLVYLGIVKQTKQLSTLLLLTMLWCFLIKEEHSSFFFLKHYIVTKTALTNGLSLVHPSLVLIFYSFLLSGIALKNRFSASKIFIYKKFNNLGVIISLSALILGSFWAQQEMNWGGWWNWDLVELILFILFLKFVVFRHCRLSPILLKKQTNLLFYTLLFYIFVRLDLISSVHSFSSFNSSEKFFAFTNLFIFYILYSYVANNINYFQRYKFYPNIHKTNSNLNFSFTLVSFYIQIIILFIYYSLLVVLIYGFDSMELLWSLQNYQVFIIVKSLFFFLNTIPNLIVFLLLTINSIFLEVLPMIILFCILKKTNIHLQLLVLLIIYLLSAPLFSHLDNLLYVSNNTKFLLLHGFSNFEDIFIHTKVIFYHLNKTEFSLFTIENFIYFYEILTKVCAVVLDCNLTSIKNVIFSYYINFLLLLSLHITLRLFFVKKISNDKLF